MSETEVTKTYSHFQVVKAKVLNLFGHHQIPLSHSNISHIWK